MAVFWGKLKTGLEWIELGKTAFELLLGFLGGQTVKSLLLRFTNIPSVWITPIWLGVAALLVGLFVFLGNRKSGKQSERAEGQNTQTQITATSTPVPETQYKKVEEFYRTYDNSMLLESEGLIRKESDQYKPGVEREQFLIRTLASGAICDYLHIRRGLVHRLWKPIKTTVPTECTVSIYCSSEKFLRRSKHSLSQYVPCLCF